MSIREYARRVGLTHPAILKAVRRGQIALVGGKVDPVAADASRAANVRPRAGGHAGGTKRAHRRPVSLVAAQERLAAAKAALAELELERARGESITREQHDRVLFTEARRLRDAVLLVPRRVAHQVHQAHATEIEQAFMRGLREALGALAADLEPGGQEDAT